MTTYEQRKRIRDEGDAAARLSVVYLVAGMPEEALRYARASVTLRDVWNAAYEDARHA